MPPSDARLPWPPPGLEPMRGRAFILARRMGLADVFLFGALAGFSLIGQPTGTRAPGPALACLALAAIGSLLLVTAAAGFWRAMREGGAYVWRGYTWLTLAEVMVDRQGNTGALIGGTNGFAELSPETRNGLRIARLVSGVARLAAGALPLPVFFLQNTIGVGPPGMTLSLAIAVLPSLLLLLFASIAGRAEWMALRPHHEQQLKRFDRRSDAIAFADEWYASFEQVRHGQSMGRGPAGGVLRAWAVGGVVGAVIVGGALALIPIWLLAAAGSAGAYSRMSYSASVQRVDQVAYLRAYGPAIDTTITAERAGEAFHTLNQRAPQTPVPYMKPRARALPDFPANGRALFPTSRQSGWSGPSVAVLGWAKKGLTAEQRAYLSAVAANPLWEEFGVVARARRADIAGGQYILPLPPDLSAAAMSGLRFTPTRDLAYANTVRAAWHLTEGRPAEAERVLRETIGFGFRMIDDGNSSLEPVIGAVMVGIGGDALVNLYTLTGHPDSARLRSQSDGARPRPATYMSDLDQVLFSRQTPRAFRYSALQARAMRSCGSVHGLLFGPSTREQREIASLRAQLARTPAEQALFDLNAQIIDRPLADNTTRRRPSWGAFRFGARISAGLLRAPRITNCATIAAWGGPSIQ